MPILTLVAPAGPAVTLPMVYDQLRLGVGLTQHPDDKLIARLVAGATTRVETMTRRALVARQIRYTLDLPVWGGIWCWARPFGWLGRPEHIRLPLAPLLEVIAVQYYDTANVLRSVDTASYRVVTVSDKMPSRVEFVYGYTPPEIFERSDAVSVVLRCGYPTPDPDDAGAVDYGSNVPEPIRDAILLLVDQAYNARLPAEDVVIDERIESMLQDHQVPRA